MTTADDLSARAASLQQQLRDVHGIRGRDLAHSLRRARGVLPRRLRKMSGEVETALSCVGHPKLEPMIDGARLRGLCDQLKAELDAVDVKERRRTQLIGHAARSAFYLLCVGAAFISWMVWADYL